MPSSSINQGGIPPSAPAPCPVPPPCLIPSQCTCPPPSDDTDSDCQGGDSDNPIQYWNGAIKSRRWPVDLPVRNGKFFSYRRTYNNRTTQNGPNGNNSFATQFVYAVGVGTSRAIVFDPNNPYWFDFNGTSYVPRYNTPGLSLTRDNTGKTLTMTRIINGKTSNVIVNDLDASVAPGRFVAFTDSLGGTTSIGGSTMGRIDSLIRGLTAGGTTVQQELVYAYYTLGTAVGKIQSVTYQKVAGGGNIDVRRVSYEYYGASDTNGSQNDLKTITHEQPNGLGGWQTVGMEYFRYYKAGDAHGFASGLKMRFGTEAYRQMFNDSVDIDGAIDSVVKPYADNYFEYDSTTQAVTKEIAAVCADCPGGGTTSDTFTYSSPSGNPDGANSWSIKTVQTLPDGATITVYTNFAGLPMLNVYTSSGGDMWGTFYKYEDTSGRNPNLLWKAHPSAVALPASLSTLEFYADLLNFSGGSYEYLNDNDGLIEVNEYYDTTDIANGKVLDYLAKRYVQKGQSGTPVLIQELTYTSHTDSNSVTIYPPLAVIDYPDDSNTSIKITTSYTYNDWYSGTNKLKKRTTTLPSIASGQNGSGTAATIVEEFDELMNLTKRTDERGIINLYEYDLFYGVVTKQTLNYQASPVGNPDENLITDYTYDDEGRLIQTLGPSHTALVSGSATTVRSATWNLYIKSVMPGSVPWGLDQVLSGQGYATGSSPSYTYTLVNPVSISRNDKNGRTIDQISSKRSSGSGKLSAADTFSQTDWKRWSSNQYNDQGQLTSSRLYYSIPSSGTGSSGTNYDQTDYGYDALERQNRVKTPGGTITRTVWAAPQRVASVWVGTDDTGATDSNPAGSGSPNNMVVIAENQYDGGNDQGDGNLTLQTNYAAASDTRVTSYGYDFRDRRTSMDGEIDLYEEYTYDNLDRLTETRRKDTSSGGNLIGKSQTFYDDRSQVYQTKSFAVASGTAGNALIGNNWYDDAGNRVASISEGAGQYVYSKTTLDAVGRITGSYLGYNTTTVSYTNSTTINNNDTIFEQSIPTYDEAGNVLNTTNYQRWNNGSGSNALTSSNARLSYTAGLYDGVGRTLAAVNYGAGSFTPPSSIPSRSDTVLVTTVDYNDAGEAYSVTDPKGIVAQNARQRRPADRARRRLRGPRPDDQLDLHR